jgi:hypothetical protein
MTLQEAWKGSHSHSFKQSLIGITQAEANWSPPHYRGFPWNSGSIREIVFHVGGDFFYQLDTAFGDGKLSWETLGQRYRQAGGDFPAALALAEEGFSHLRATLESLSDADLTRKIKTPSGGQIEASRLFRMLTEHLFYHAGQIVYVRSLWAGLQAASSAGDSNPRLP